MELPEIFDMDWWNNAIYSDYGLLYEQLNKGSISYLEIYRGQSSNPLYVSATGIDLNYSAKLIKDFKGNFRIPDILKKG